MEVAYGFEPELGVEDEVVLDLPCQWALQEWQMISYCQVDENEPPPITVSDAISRLKLRQHRGSLET